MSVYSLPEPAYPMPERFSQLIKPSSRLSSLTGLVRKASSLGGITPTTRISTSSLSIPLTLYGGGGGGSSAGSCSSLIGADGKATMQNLNDRLAAYLEKVRSLEAANGELERKIREWYEKRAPVARDYSAYEKTIAGLRKQIGAMTQMNAKIILQIDNARLASDDFKVKYEAELALRQSVEADVVGLRRVLDDLTLTRSALEAQVEALQEELIYLKKNHQEALLVLRSQLGGQVSVEVDAAPQQDLMEVLEEIRAQYEGIAEKNRRDMEGWYKGKFDVLSQQVSVSTEALQSSKSEISELKRAIQGLEIELQSLLSLKAALEATLRETAEGRGEELARLQGVVHRLEGELAQVRGDAARHGDEYQTLLDIKTRLEREISMYRRLLDGEDSRSIAQQAKEITVSRARKVQTIVEEVVDGRVVSSRVEEVVQKI
ncbi:keratin, type I cytoskeletal 42-like [Lepisosteus oculatus]|uniref:keratin, type I cytoskeletal 42-like n=1 Tax=Lepisosteus oculatus TaxID=7918 RepID=UPI003722D0B3